MSRKRRRKKPRRPLSTWEMIFCVGSLLLMIGVGVYYGYRSMFYYSKQNYRLSSEAATLKSRIVYDNKLVKEGDGLHQDTEGYYYKGIVNNNYVKYSNRLFRIIRVNNDDTIRIISDDIGASFMWGIDSKYENSNVRHWLDNTNNNNSGVYYNTLAGIDKLTVKTKYTIDKLEEDKVVPGKDKNTSSVTTLGIKDYVDAGGKNSFLNIGKAFWILGYQNDSNLYVSPEGSLEESTTYESYGVRAVITLKKDITVVGGSGTKEDPYVIDQGKYKNDVDNYVKLGNDLWKINVDSKEGYYTMYAADYLKIGDVITSPYDLEDNVLFEPDNKKNIGYFLNHNYFDTLTYRDYLLLTPFRIGEVSLDTDYVYYRNFDEEVLAKVGLLNIFDYYSGELDDFFYLNNTGEVSDMLFIHNKEGYLEEDGVDVYRKVVPCVSISKQRIIGGSGSREDPYRVS